MCGGKPPSVAVAGVGDFLCGDGDQLAQVAQKFLFLIRLAEVNVDPQLFRPIAVLLRGP